jgi:hypothetical protein
MSGEWINSEIRLPPENKEVLIWYQPDGFEVTSIYYTHKWQWPIILDYELEYIDIEGTFWRELPEEPEGITK